ncbi:iron-containing redox enzyme family protein [Streptomyces roseicoloratus]|uniref:Iron-containing redox enzyme family protein n=1 Tax=Streptomyces roseicoloratus TaxID=2508722 RepID=A0ABY9RNL1_9ACTN|nr:iron-containing redox enzyme family protein [Streptomyces roseicoloratus]WMX43765.1 iron-containing redox enzyme family protein [Streptomyces roseicoloratus]
MTTTLLRESEERTRPEGGPPLPEPRGELSEALVARLRGGSGALPGRRATEAAEPYGEDLQLALHLAYELHYQGFAGVPDEAEWDPAVLELRTRLEHRFEDALRADCGRPAALDEVFAVLLTEPQDGDGVSHYLIRHGTREHVREHAVLRSVHQLREADPHLWVVPRLRGRAKAGMITIQYDEYGCGRAEHMHARLYADLLSALGLDPSYGHYLPLVGAPALANANLMSLLGLHRARRGALVGHFAALEIGSSPAASRIAAAMRRIGTDEAAVRFYDEHVEADAVHEQLVRREVVGGLLAEEPGLARDVAFGAEATVFLEDAFAASVTQAWEKDTTALRAPLDDRP